MARKIRIAERTTDLPFIARRRTSTLSGQAEFSAKIVVAQYHHAPTFLTLGLTTAVSDLVTLAGTKSPDVASSPKQFQEAQGHSRLGNRNSDDAARYARQQG